MNLTSIAKTITDKSTIPLLKLQKSSPKLLFVGGAIGIVAAGVLACRATLQLESVLDQAESDLKKINDARALEMNVSEADRIQGVTGVYVRSGLQLLKLYGPSVLLGAASIGALASSQAILTRRNATTTAAFIALTEGFSKYRSRVADKFGVEAERDINFDITDREIIVETAEGPIVKKSKQVGEGKPLYARAFDSWSKHWKPEPGYNLTFLRMQQNHANDLLHSRGILFLNTVYHMLGIPETPEGQKVGWILNAGNSDNFVDFRILQFDPEGGESFILGDSDSVWIDPNVDGEVYKYL